MTFDNLIYCSFTLLAATTVTAHLLTPLQYGASPRAIRALQFPPVNPLFHMEVFAISSNKTDAGPLEIRQTGTCDDGEVICGSKCIPSTYTCCPALSGGCQPGYYCDTLGCCENGKICSGAPTSCTEDDQQCGVNCLPKTYTCCPGATTGCPSSEFCFLGTDGTYGCCENGQTCTSQAGNGNGGGSSGGSSGGGGSTGGGSQCGTGEKACGSGCVPSTDTCCPDGSGGCPSGSYCTLASNGIYGCCANGQTCSGSAPGGGSQCGTGEKACGSGCIPSTDTCCPDQSGGCPSGSYCDLASNGVYGCCTNGKTCSGSAPGGGGGGGGTGGTTYSSSFLTSSIATTRRTSTALATSSTSSFVAVPPEPSTSDSSSSSLSETSSSTISFPTESLSTALQGASSAAQATASAAQTSSGSGNSSDSSTLQVRLSSTVTQLVLLMCLLWMF